jgi:hypothetical protein
MLRKVLVLTFSDIRLTADTGSIVDNEKWS